MTRTMAVGQDEPRVDELHTGDAVGTREPKIDHHTALRGDGRVAWRGDVGMATAEYAIATVAAAGFAGLLVVILRSNEVRALLLGIVRGALSV